MQLSATRFARMQLNGKDVNACNHQQGPGLRGLRSRAAAHKLLAEAEVDELDVTVGVDHQILRLHVTVDEVARVHVLGGECERADDETGELSGEGAFRGEQRPKLS